MASQDLTPEALDQRGRAAVGLAGLSIQKIGRHQVHDLQHEGHRFRSRGQLQPQWD